MWRVIRTRQADLTPTVEIARLGNYTSATILRNRFRDEGATLFHPRRALCVANRIAEEWSLWRKRNNMNPNVYWGLTGGLFYCHTDTGNSIPSEFADWVRDEAHLIPTCSRCSRKLSGVYSSWREMNFCSTNCHSSFVREEQRMEQV